MSNVVLLDYIKVLTKGTIKPWGAIFEYELIEHLELEKRLEQLKNWVIDDLAAPEIGSFVSILVLSLFLTVKAESSA